MRWNRLWLAALTVTPALSIFSDEAFQIDFHQALLGLPQPHTTFFHKPDSSSNAALLYSLSEKNVLGAINPRDGSVVWRQMLSPEVLKDVDAFVSIGENDGKITTAFRSAVTAWDASNGRLLWTFHLPSSSKAAGLQPVPLDAENTNDSAQDVVVLSQEKAGYSVQRLRGDGTGEIWRYEDTTTASDSQVYITTTPMNVFYITRSAGVISGQKTKVVVLDIASGKHIKDYPVSLDGESAAASGQLVTGSSAAPFMITAEKPLNQLKISFLGNTKVFNVKLQDTKDVATDLKVYAAKGASAARHFLVHVQTAVKHSAQVYHINPESSEVTHAYTISETGKDVTFSVSSNSEKVYFTSVTEDRVTVYSSDSSKPLGSWSRNQLGSGHTASSRPVWAVAEVAGRDAASVAVRTAVFAPEGNWYLIRNGDTQWTRPEMLAYADMALWSDDVELDALAQELNTEISADPATAYINRVYRHASELMHLPAWLLALPQKILRPSDDAAKRQALVGSKSLILKTTRNQLFSIDAVHGKVDWHTDLAPSLDVRSLASQEGRITVYTSSGSVVVFNATTGSIAEKKDGSIPLEYTVELPGSPASTILKIDANGTPRLPSDLAPSTPAEGNGLVTVNAAGELCGWSVGSKAEKIWTFKPSTGNILTITARPAHDPIAAIGKVLGDRSVLYKYFTPNLVVVSTLSEEVLTVYLIDAITGSVLHTATHAGVLPSSPVSAVLSENWFSYTFTSVHPETRAITTQLVVSELYESSTPNDRGPLSAKANYSSFEPDGAATPHVQSIAFSISEPISHLGVTQTTQGITSRNVLAYLPNSQAIASIPRYVLDPRRPVDRDPSAAEAEEGLFRYQPYLELDPKSYISHSRQIAGIQKIMTSPTLLESTSMVFAYGHDIFGTQVAPSQTFDILGNSFKKGQLVATVVALYFGVLAIRPLVRRKVVERGWL